MVTFATLPASRFRRRILGLGALAVGALYVIGAPIFVDSVEADLDARVPSELARLGFPDVTAEFSGQDGNLVCDRPLDDPEGARAAAYDIRGVRRIELDRSCRVLAAELEPAASAGSPETVGVTDASADDGELTTVATSTPTTEAELPTIVDIVAANPGLGFLSLLLAETDFPGADGPVTLFAPSNAAFDAVSAELAALLQNDPAMLATVLRHHAVSGIVPGADLVDGELTALDGTTLVVAAGPPPTVDGATVVDADIEASDGVVHVIDRVLIPDTPGLPVAEQPAATASVTWADGNMVLTGVVASEVERNQLVSAAVAAAGLGFVSDQTTVDPEVGVDAVVAGRLAALIVAMPANLVSGVATFDGVDVSVTGIYRSEQARDVFIAAAAGATVELQPPPVATTDDAVALEAQLNEFVAQNPIRFEPGAAVLGDTALAVVDRLARDSQQFTGVGITVEGHTDSDGDAGANLRLSQARADAVRVALVERGVAPEAITATGFGSERPVLVDGVEDKGASRRVEFRVVTA
ncbi:MAG: fasciclin domain-containing protein [Ilumatobacteraceae bacterium]